MVRALPLVVALIIAIGVAALWLRAQWIDRKTEPLRHPPLVRQFKSQTCVGLHARQVVLVGDSRVARWPVMFFPAGTINRGIAGETALQMAARFEADVIARCPGTVLIASGINDLVAASLIGGNEASSIPNQVARTLIDLAEQAAATGARVYIATIVPPASPDLLRRLVWSWSVVDYVAQVNDVLRTHSWRGSVSILDFAAELDPESLGVLDRNFRTDTLHLNPSAYRQLTKIIPFAKQL